MRINVHTSRGERYEISIDVTNTIILVKKHLSELEAGIPIARQQLSYEGKILEDERRLSDYNFGEFPIVHLAMTSAQSPEQTVEFPRDKTSSLLARLEQEGLTTKLGGDAWKWKAVIGDFDEDRDIVDPQDYYKTLESLQHNVVRRSELFRGDASYSLRSEMTPDEIEKTGLEYMPSRLFSYYSQSVLSESDDISYADRSMLVKLSGGCNFPKSEGFEGEKKRCWSHIALFWRSYIIIRNVDKSLSEFRAHDFCNLQINALLKHHGEDIVEIKSIPVDLVKTLKKGMEVALDQTLQQTSMDSLRANLVECVLTPCKHIWQIFGSDLTLYETVVERLTSEEIVEHVQLTTCLLDAIVVSYAGSHGSNFCEKYFESNVESIELTDSLESRGFQFRLRSLACLNEFIDGHKVWVIEMRDPEPNIYQLDCDRLDARLSVLTKIQDLADIWGPVWTIPARSGLIRRYDVSKGMICPVESPAQCQVEGAVQCHYISRASYGSNRVLHILNGDGKPLLAADDLLLIGAGLHANPNCSYGMGHFTADHAHELGPLGTRPEAWKTESRGLSLGLSKIVGLTVSGTQKLIPQTSLKQRILDKWTNNPSRANPGILNQLLGIQISHCTGNARRISLKELLLTDSIAPVLERQIPGWTYTRWGSRFSSALRSDSPEAIFHMWKDFVDDRAQIAALVRDVLDLLDSTGQKDERKLYAAHLANRDELTITIDTRYNDWSIALRDTHLMAAYVIVDDICLESDVVGYRISSCSGSKAFTVLQTYFTIEGGTFCKVGNHVKLEPSGYLMKRLDSCSDEIINVEMSLNVPGIDQAIRMINLGRPLQKVIESRNPSSRLSSKHFYVWALRLSFNGTRNGYKRLTSLETRDSRDRMYFPNRIGHCDFDSIPMISTFSNESVEATEGLSKEQGADARSVGQYRNNEQSAERGMPSMANSVCQVYAASVEERQRRPRKAESDSFTEDTLGTELCESVPQLADLYGSSDIVYDMKVFGIDDAD